MHAFTDAKGRKWPLAINVAVQGKVKALVGVDLFKLTDDGGRALAELLGDLPRLVDVLYVLCKEECEKAGVSDEDFGRGFGGDAIEQAAEAFVEELIDFFPNARARAVLREVLVKKGKKLQDLILTRAEKELAKLNSQDLEKDLDALLKRSFGRLPASSASTPGPLPSGN